MKKLTLKMRMVLCRLFLSPVFMIQVEDGNARKISGNVRHKFIVECTDIVKQNEIKSGFIYAVKGQYEKPILKVSSEIHTDVLQQLRNTWDFN